MDSQSSELVLWKCPDCGQTYDVDCECVCSLEEHEFDDGEQEDWSEDNRYEWDSDL